MARKYLVYEGKNLIGEMNSVEGEKLLHVSRRRFAECANNGGKLKGRYEIKLLEENTLRKNCREGFWEEWEEITAILREEISVEKLIWGSWEETVKPFRRRNWMWRT